MAKVKLGALQPDALTRSVGSFQIVGGKYGLHARTWPKKRGKAKTPYEFYHQQEFGLVARWASSPEPVGYQTAINLAKTSNQVPRDIEMMTSYGTFYQIVFDDGTPVSYYRMVAPNAQLVLDQVTDTVGAMLYRSNVGWVEVPPGSNGYFLQINDLAPSWVHYAPTSAPASKGNLFGLLNFPTPNTTTFGVTQGTMITMPAGSEIIGVEMYVNTASASAKITPCLYSRTANVPGARVALGSQVTGVSVGLNQFPFSAPYVVPTTDLYFIGAAINVNGIAIPQSNSTIASWNFPTTPPPSTAPTISNGYNSTFLKCWPY